VRTDAGLVTAALGCVRLLWPQGQISAGGSALGRLTVAPFGEHVASATLLIGSRRVAASVRSGRLEPTVSIPAGTRVRVEATVRRAGWLGWLVGSTEHLQTVLETPAVHVGVRLLSPAPGRPVVVAFSGPVRAVSLQLGAGPRRLLRLSRPRSRVSIGVDTAGRESAGSAFVAGVQHLWERFPPPVRVSWIERSSVPEMLVRPAAKGLLGPTAAIVLTFSRPVGAVLGARRPSLWPRVAGVWHEPDGHTLVFQPSGLGFPLGSHVRLGLTRSLRVLSGSDPSSVRTLSWRVPPAGKGRLVQLLGELGYLPFASRPVAGDVPRSAQALARAVLSLATGTLRWRYRPPPALRTLWDSAAGAVVLIRGALMAFESVHGLTPDGVESPGLWRALLRAELARRGSPYGYSYVYVSETVPQTLTLWHDGRVVLRTPVNTGISAAPTALGTYPVYLHLAATTMTGTNPDGSHYSDPGVPWVNYFNGGDAVHGFVRPGYGYPQSLGCVEAPITTAALIWPFVQVGTLVTVAT